MKRRFQPRQLPSQPARSRFQGEPTVSGAHCACVSPISIELQQFENFEADRVDGNLLLQELGGHRDDMYVYVVPAISILLNNNQHYYHSPFNKRE